MPSTRIQWNAEHERDAGEIAERIRQARLNRGMSQKELAEAIGMGVVAISNYEGNRNVPGSLALKGLCLTLNVSADWVLGLSTRGGPR